jgi:DNA-binding PadR family transcriptional regulator
MYGFDVPRRPNSSPQTKALLACFLDAAPEWRHGYDLSKATGLKSGSLYPTLIRLADQGYLESRWCEPDKPGRPPRHAYRLTAKGVGLARDQVGAVEPPSVLHPSGATA